MGSKYDLRKKMGICVRCCKRPAVKGTVRCEICTQLNRGQTGEPHRVIDHNPNKKLDSDALEASKQGLTYGKYKMRLFLESMKEG